MILKENWDRAYHAEESVEVAEEAAALTATHVSTPFVFYEILGLIMVQKILELRVGCTEIKADVMLRKSKWQIGIWDGMKQCLVESVGIAFDTLKKMKANRFFEMHMNVCALKRRLQDKLRERRFEEGRLHADYHPSSLITRATERRGGVFKRLANKINAPSTMTVLKKSRAAPRYSGYAREGSLQGEKRRLTWEVTAAVKWFGEEEEIQLALLHAENPVTSYHVALDLICTSIWVVYGVLIWMPLVSTRLATKFVHATMHKSGSSIFKTSPPDLQ
ncbi:hypothetical protein BS47DRAFT_1364581 [Hydnum rufescens UP504]|uniref:Uncharacterized protein n=1 Tax=Hydnum rufescens UP504 TaxID=1448309 RepID=A0A9P6AT48_9AGAM|nr:hypothetical protein BS47DRAFT_1364581 [Hydnum rufescens UP504]